MGRRAVRSALYGTGPPLRPGIGPPAPSCALRAARAASCARGIAHGNIPRFTVGDGPWRSGSYFGAALDGRVRLRILHALCEWKLDNISESQAIVGALSPRRRDDVRRFRHDVTSAPPSANTDEEADALRLLPYASDKDGAKYSREPSLPSAGSGASPCYPSTAGVPLGVRPHPGVPLLYASTVRSSLRSVGCADALVLGRIAHARGGARRDRPHSPVSA